MTETQRLTTPPGEQKILPQCPVFGICSGCAYQDLPYEEELRIKRAQLASLLDGKFGAGKFFVSEVVPSPQEYHTRSRLDLTFRLSRQDGPVMGFVVEHFSRVIQVESCAIARQEISDFLPELKRQAVAKLPPDYRTANLVVKSGDDRRVFWGGIGRRSLKMLPRDYLWTEISGKKIFYSLDTFFQANLAILPVLMQTIASLARFGRRDTLFLDLYAGVGLFGVYFAQDVSEVVMIEENPASTELAGYNLAYHGIRHAQVRLGKVETELPEVLAGASLPKKIGLIDPPRQGLSGPVLEMLAKGRQLDALFYLSCSPESLIRDLAEFLSNGWEVQAVIPFDFFPKTRHLEVLVLLKPSGAGPS